MSAKAPATPGQRRPNQQRSGGRGEGKPYSDFDTGGLLTEIGLSGVVAVRAGKTLDWDGPSMRATNAPEADKFIRTEQRAKWLA